MLNDLTDEFLRVHEIFLDTLLHLLDKGNQLAADSILLRLVASLDLISQESFKALDARIDLDVLF